MIILALMPDQDVTEITRQTYNRIAEEYCKSTPRPGVRQTIINVARTFSALLPASSSVLVLGAGDGRDGEVFIVHGHRVTLLDYSTSMLELAKKRVLKATVVLADFRFMDFPAEHFDGVWASACLYHIPKAELPSVIAQVGTILKPGGLFYFNLRRGSDEFLDSSPRSYPKGGPRFYAFYCLSEVYELIRGFELLQFTAIDPTLKEDYFQVLVRRPVSCGVPP